MSNKSNETIVTETVTETHQTHKDPYLHLNIPKPITVLASTGGFVKRHVAKVGIFAAGALSATAAILLTKDDDASDPSVETDTEQLEIEEKSSNDLDLDRLSAIMSNDYDTQSTTE